MYPLSSKTFYRYLKNQSVPTVDFLVEISKILSISLYTILDLPDDSIGMEKEDDGFFHKSVHSIKKHEKQAYRMTIKESEWINSLRGRGDRISISYSPPIYYYPDSVIESLYPHLFIELKSKLDREESKVIDEIKSYKNHIVEMSKNIFRREIYLQSGILNFARGKSYFSEISVDDRIKIVENMIADYEKKC